MVGSAAKSLGTLAVLASLIFSLGCSEDSPGGSDLTRLVVTSAVLSNGGFEDALPGGAAHPPYWYIGDPGAPSTAGTWSLDSAESTDGGKSLKLSPTGLHVASQLLHVPGTGLAGKPITFRVRVKHQGMSSPPVVLMYAINKEILTIDPIFGTSGFSGSAGVQVSATQGVWHEVTGSMTSSTEAVAVGIKLVANSATGTAWFDQVEVDSPGWSAEGVAPSTPVLPITSRSFDMGFTSSTPMDSSDRGFENLVHLAKTTGNVMNFFVGIRWCRLAANPVPCENDTKHAHTLGQIEQAKAAGLKIVLTFNTDHATAAGVGNLNPLPDGTTSPGTMLDANVRTALKDELMWLYGQTDPDYVITGIEMNIMKTANPTWWAPFVALHGQIYDAIKAIDSSTHVTTYFTHEWAVNSSGGLNASSVTAWQELLPKLDSIAFSSYPVYHFPGVPAANYPSGYFSRPREIAPNLPLMLPEFGVAGGDGATLTEVQQVELLQRMIGEVATGNPVALIYYQPFDMNYLGQPQFYKDTWSKIGFGRLEGTAKSSYFLWESLFKLGQ